LRDAYIEWDEERQIDWAVRYWEKARGTGLPVGE
jgi:aminoglycoside/choline kinase family phosphotransferase